MKLKDSLRELGKQGIQLIFRLSHAIFAKKKKAVRKTGPDFDIPSGSGTRYLSVKVSQVIAKVG